MADGTSRVLENRVRLGDSDALRRLKDSCLRTGEIDKLRVFGAVCLGAGRTDYLIESGLPWIKFDDVSNQMKLFNVLYQNKGRKDTKPVRYNFLLDVDHFVHDQAEHVDSDTGIDTGINYFVQGDVAQLVKGRSDGKVVMDVGEFIASGMFLDRVSCLGFQPLEVTRGQCLLRESYELLVGTSTKAKYGEGVVTHNLGREDEFDEHFDLRGNRGYLAELEDGQRIAQAVLWTPELVSDIDRVHNALLDFQRGSHIWRISGSGERAVMLCRYEGGRFFDVNANINADYSRPVRLLVPERVESVSSENGS